MDALGKSVELERKADYYAAKAEAAEHNRAIYAEDDDAVENLTARSRSVGISSGAYESG